MAAACGGGVEEELPFDSAYCTELEGGDVSSEFERVGTRGCKEVFTTVREKDDIGTVQSWIRDTCMTKLAATNAEFWSLYLAE